MQTLQSTSLSLLREIFPGQINIGLTDAARILGIASQTAYNKAVAGTFPVLTFKIGSKRVCSILDLAIALDTQRGFGVEHGQGNSEKRRPGRPRKMQLPQPAMRGG